MKPTTYFMEKYRYLCLYANLSPMPHLSVSLDQKQKIRKIDSILFSYVCIYCKREAFWHKIHILNCLRTF